MSLDDDEFQNVAGGIGGDESVHDAGRQEHLARRSAGARLDDDLRRAAEASSFAAE
jgi:hypothetical protein